MEWLIFILGVALGILTACVSFLRLRIGTLKIACESDSEAYLFLELSEPDVLKIAERHYALLEVDQNVIYSQE